MMERQQILATMGELKLYGMKAAFGAISKWWARATIEERGRRAPERSVSTGGRELQ